MALSNESKSDSQHVLHSGDHVPETILKLWRNGQTKNWTADINGERYEAVTVETIHELVNRALLDAEESSRQSGGIDNGQATIVIADDNREILKLLTRLLQPSFRIVSLAEDGETALRAIQTHQPELAILDICMPMMSGIEVARQLRANHSSTKVVFLTLEMSNELIEEARRYANGYVTKMRLSSDLYRSLDAALRGEFFVSD
jgi:CheY-like chemotaxis protein